MIRISLLTLCISYALVLCRANSFRRSKSSSTRDVNYYSRENCEALGFLPQWSTDGYTPVTHFEKLFKSPLAIDLLASAHSSNETGFEQVTADWGCDYKQCYGSECEEIGFFGPGPKDPAGGGCPRGPVRVYEDLTCAIRLGLFGDEDVFNGFCGGSGDRREGAFECLAFFANVLTETGAFAETEERDPRPYCWDRSEGNSNCCPSEDHQPCLPDSDQELSKDDFPSPVSSWLGNTEETKKCCSYHGRGFLQVSYEPNYRSLSRAMVGDESVLWNHPYKLDSDGVAGWTAALWFWFNKHDAQVLPEKPEDQESASEEDKEKWASSPRDRLVAWREGGGLPGAINIINGGECGGFMDTKKALSRISFFFAIAHRLGAKPPQSDLEYYPLPGTAECEATEFCRLQFHNNESECKVLQQSVDCTTTPFIANVSTPMGFYRKTLKMTKIDGQTPICKFGKGLSATPAVWSKPQADFEPIPEWEKMLDVTVENVCDYVKLLVPSNSGAEGNSKNCKSVCWKDFSSWSDGGDCGTEDQKPCQVISEWMSHPLPAKNWESGEMGGYMGSPYLGRVGPGLVMAMNGKYGFGDSRDRLCFWFGGSRCHWTIGQGDFIAPEDDIHSCRIVLPGVSDETNSWTDADPDDGHIDEALLPGEFPEKLRNVLNYWDPSECPPKEGKTIIEKLFKKGALDFDKIFSMHYSQDDGYDNTYFDSEGNLNVNHNILGAGKMGPKIVYDQLVCALQKGIPTDPDFFAKRFGLANDIKDTANIPSELSEEQFDFAMMEVMALFANVVKETGNLGQAEERDPRSYCNDQGGSPNPCCPNEWQNNQRCYTTATKDNTLIPPEELRRSMGTNATCCTYHGRGFVQVSYEKNYGDIAAVMLEDPSSGVDSSFARRLGVNFPQFIDAFGITGWVSSLLYWTDERPCQYCNGRNTTTIDWNAVTVSPHASIQSWKTPGRGLGEVFTIINGQECEAPFTHEANVSQLGAQDRLSLFYNLAYRLNAKPPGESLGFYPLPGTKECDGSEWCKGTFSPASPPKASYRQYGGGCWALTPQPAEGEDADYWTYCVPKRVQGGSKFGSQMDTIIFSLFKPEENSCEIRHEFFCGLQKIERNNKPSMLTDPELKPYTEFKEPCLDHDKPGFVDYIGKTPEELCAYVEDKDPSNLLPRAPQDCNFWCSTPSGAASCKLRDDKTCLIRGKGLPFVDCANEKFSGELKSLAGDCFIPKFSGGHFPPPPTTTTQAPMPCTSCSVCTGASGRPEDNTHCSKCASGKNPLEWPCNLAPFCKCEKGSEIITSSTTSAPTTTTTISSDIPPTPPSLPVSFPPPPTPSPAVTAPPATTVASTKVSTAAMSQRCSISCIKCVSIDGASWNDEHCSKCNGTNDQDWPCGPTTNMCKCLSQ